MTAEILAGHPKESLTGGRQWWEGEVDIDVFQLGKEGSQKRRIVGLKGEEGLPGKRKRVEAMESRRRIRTRLRRRNQL